eukprot:PhM_4_TR5789/c0_g1_i1/m.79697/K17533/MAP3K19, YSK4; mitogen-activated protein kinase kinase kinase 19
MTGFHLPLRITLPLVLVTLVVSAGVCTGIIIYYSLRPLVLDLADDVTFANLNFVTMALTDEMKEIDTFDNTLHEFLYKGNFSVTVAEIGGMMKGLLLSRLRIKTTIGGYCWMSEIDIPTNSNWLTCVARVLTPELQSPLYYYEPSGWDADSGRVKQYMYPVDENNTISGKSIASWYLNLETIVNHTMLEQREGWYDINLWRERMSDGTRYPQVEMRRYATRRLRTGYRLSTYQWLVTNHWADFIRQNRPREEYEVFIVERRTMELAVTTLGSNVHNGAMVHVGEGTAHPLVDKAYTVVGGHLRGDTDDEFGDTVSYDGERYFVRAKAISVGQMRWHVVSLLPTSVIMSELDRATAISFGVMGAIVAVAAVIAVIVAVGVTSPLLALSKSMERASEFNVEDVDGHADKHIMWSEVQAIHTSFVELARSMLQYKGFLPMGLFEKDETPSSSAPTTSEELMMPPTVPPKDAKISMQRVSSVVIPASSAATQRNSTTSNSSSTMNASTTGKSSQPRAATFTQEMRQRCATFLGVRLTMNLEGATTADVHAIFQRFVCIVAETVIDHDGLPNQVHTDWMLCSWNAPKTCSRHETHACQAALDINQRLAFAQLEHPALSWCIAVVAGSFKVGYVGVAKFKSPITLGAPLHHLRALLDLAEATEAPIVVTERVASRARTEVPCCAMDHVVFKAPAEYTGPVYCVVPTQLDVAALQPVMDAYAEGFSSMLSLEWSGAVKRFSDVARMKDIDAVLARQVLRLAKVCTHYAQATEVPFASRYRRTLQGWDDFESPSSNADLGVSFEKLRAVVDSKDVAQRPLEMHSDTIESDVIREQIKEQNLSDSPRGFAVSSVNDSVPIELTSINKVLYFRSDRMLGVGAAGEVWLGMQADGGLVALKSTRLPEASGAVGADGKKSKKERRKEVQVESLILEVDVLVKLRHDNIVSYLGTIVTSNFVVLVLEFVSGGSLATVLSQFPKLPTTSIQRYLRETLQGLAYLHENDIVHRDIKPHNVLLMNDGQCKLSDFGASASLGSLQEGKKSVNGTPVYMAPEACRGTVDKASDIWSLGVMAAEMMMGEVPYTKGQLGQPFVAVNFLSALGQDETFFPTIPRMDDFPCGRVAHDFVMSCLKRDSASRPTAEHLLAHPFLLS